MIPPRSFVAAVLLIPSLAMAASPAVVTTTRGLVVAARADEQPEDGLHLALGKAQLPRHAAAVVQQLRLATGVTDAERMLPLVLRDLADERHATGDDLQQVAVEHVDHGAKDGQRARGGFVVGHG